MYPQKFKTKNQKAKTHIKNVKIFLCFWFARLPAGRYF